MPSSKGSSQAKDETLVSYVSCIGRQGLYHWCHLGSPLPHLEERKHSKFLLQSLIPGYQIPPALPATALCPPCSHLSHSKSLKMGKHTRYGARGCLWQSSEFRARRPGSVSRLCLRGNIKPCISPRLILGFFRHQMGFLLSHRVVWKIR